jgi:hypothetical protein
MLFAKPLEFIMQRCEKTSTKPVPDYLSIVYEMYIEVLKLQIHIGIQFRNKLISNLIFSVMYHKLSRFNS